MSVPSAPSNSSIFETKIENLNILSYNIFGNLSLKIENPDFLDIIDKYDVVFLNECWINKNDSFEIQNFKCFKKHRKKSKKAKRNSGGLCVFIKNAIAEFFEECEWDFEDGFILKSKYLLKELEHFLYIVFAYMRPSSSSRNEIANVNDVYECLLDKLTDIRNSGEIILIGDFNARTGKLTDILDPYDFDDDNFFEENIIAENYIDERDLIFHGLNFKRENEDSKINDYGHKLLKVCQISGMFICNGRIKGDEKGSFTYIDKKGKSVIDYAILSKGLIQYVDEFIVKPLSVFSDHCPIALKMKSFIFTCDLIDNFDEYNDDMIDETQNGFKNYFYKWNSDSCALFESRLEYDFSVSNLRSVIDILKDYDNDDNEIIDKCIFAVECVMNYAARPFLRTIDNNQKDNSHYSEHKKSWYDLECREKKKDFDLAINIYKETNEDIDLKNLCNIRNSYRLLCRKKNRKYKENKADELLKLSKENSRAFWKKIKRKKKRQMNTNCDFDLYFKNLYENTTSEVSDEINVLLDDFNNSATEINDDFLDKDFTMQELDQAIKKLKNNKSPGSDNIINEFLMNNTLLFKTALLCIFNVILSTGYFPSSWTLGLIVPIHKNGDVSKTENYRGISLISCISKLFTNMINIRLNKWSENNSVYDNFQFGFREKRSTVDAIFLLQSIVEYFLSMKKQLFVSFIDLKKAFDKTHHNALWYKLHECNVSTKIVNVIKNMYERMKLCVKSTFHNSNTNIQCYCNNENHLELIDNPCTCYYEKCLSDDSCYFSPAAGVLQGESLSPLLFSMYLSDINTSLKNDPHVGINVFHFFMTMILFADDMALVSESKFGLQRGLDNVHDYCVKWGLQVNVDKTKCLVFKNGGKINKNDKWTYNGNHIETVNYFKYLGFVFGSSGKFHRGIENLAQRGEKALFDMISSINDFKDMDFKMKIDLFNSLVKSVLCYSCELWGFNEAKRHETIHLRFLKNILCVRKNIPSSFVYSECHVYPLYITRTFRIINYWLKIMSLDEQNPVKIMYSIILNISYREKAKPAFSWIENVKNTLFKYGFGYIWENQDYVKYDISFIHRFKTTVTDSFWQENNGNINELSNNRLYRNLNLESIDYLNLLPNNFIRIAITKLRLGSHYFMIERGRWKKLELIDRLCIFCNEIEDEYHIVMCCKRYNNLRKKYLPKTLIDKPSMFKFVNFLNTKDIKSLKNLGLFIFNVFKLYEENELYRS